VSHGRDDNRCRGRPALKSSEGLQHFRGEGLEFAETAVADFRRPARIGEQGAADRHEVKIAARQHFGEAVEMRGAGGAVAGRGARVLRAAKRREEVYSERDRADGDGRLARELLGPAREIEVAALELRLPEEARGAVETVEAGGGQRLEEPG